MKFNFHKKSLIVLLTFFYSLCAVGMDVKAHYCHGKLVSISIGFKEDKCCCKKKMSSKCCTSKEVSLKIQEKQIKTADVFFSPNKFVDNAILRANDLFVFSSKPFTVNAFRCLHFHLPSTSSLLILHQVFRI